MYQSVNAPSHVTNSSTGSGIYCLPCQCLTPPHFSGKKLKRNGPKLGDITSKILLLFVIKALKKKISEIEKTVLSPQTSKATGIIE